MSNLTAAATNRDGRLFADTINFTGLISTSYFRGGALLLDQAVSGTGRGYLSRVLDGTLHGVFVGVCMRNVVTPALPNPPNLFNDIPVQRHGTHSFEMSGAAITDIGRKVWFTDDNNVSKTPPSQDFPIYAGRIIAVDGTTVEVDIEDAIMKPPGVWQRLTLGQFVFAGSSAVEHVIDLPLDQRLFVRELSSVVVIAATDNDLDDIELHKDAAAVGTPSEIVTGDGIGVINTGAINTLYEANETLTLSLNADAAVGTSENLFWIRYMNLD